MSANIDPLELISDPELSKLLNISLRSFARWDVETGNDFPQPIYINRRKFRRRGEIEEWLQRCARDSLAAHAAAAPKSNPPKAPAKQARVKSSAASKARRTGNA